MGSSPLLNSIRRSYSRRKKILIDFDVAKRIVEQACRSATADEGDDDADDEDDRHSRHNYGHNHYAETEFAEFVSSAIA